jgi:chemotaxis protein MotB
MSTMLLLLVMGCVPKGKYLELETQLAGSVDTVAARDAELDERDATIDADMATIAGLETDIEKLKGEIGAKSKALDSLRQEKAEILGDKGRLREEVNAMKEALADLEARKAQADARMAEYQNLIDKFKSLIDAGTLEVRISNGRMVVALATDVLFGSGSAALSKEGKDTVAEVGKVLASIGDREFQIEGHTDNVPIGTEQYPNNWYLAAARAIGVSEHMIAAGMPPDRISAASYGENRPTDTNRTKEGKSRNRRIEIVVVPDLSQLPGYDELEAAGAPAE